MLWLSVEIESLFTLDSSGSAWLLKWDHIHIFISTQTQGSVPNQLGHVEKKKKKKKKKTEKTWYTLQYTITVIL